MRSKPAGGEAIHYRPNVAAIVQHADGRILLCERADVAGAWQFPQGGRDDGESDEEALARELEEELSLRPGDYEILQSKGIYRYRFPNGRMKKGCHGQQQTYFLVRLTAPESRINVETDSQEFTRTRWMRPEEFDLDAVIEMKRSVYRQVFRDFFGM